MSAPIGKETTRATRNDIALESLIDPENGLVKLALALDWEKIGERFQTTFSVPFGGRVLPTRMLLGLSVLRQLYELSDLALYNLWSENPYFQYFCGGDRFQRHPPFDQIVVRMLPRLSDQDLQSLFGSGPSGHSDRIVSVRSIFSNAGSTAWSTAEQVGIPPRTEVVGGAAGNSKPPKINDVAKHAGVSVKTVSLVLNRHPNVSKRTRKVVHDAVRALSYKPNVFARGLATLQSNLIAILYEREGEFISALESGALDRCREAGFQLIVESLDSHAKDLSDKTRKLVSRTALHGVIVIPPLCDMPDVVGELIASGTQCVTISAGRPVTGISNVGVDEYQIGYDVTEHLIGIGHRRIGYIGGLPDHYAAIQRKEGYIAALKTRGIPLDVELVENGSFTLESGRVAAKKLLRQKNRPTAIFAASDQMAAGVLGEAQSMGLSVPKELSIAGVDDSVIAQIVWPQLTTCHQPIKKMAYAAVSILLLSGQEERPDRLHLEHKLVVRGSSAPPQSCQGDMTP